MIRLTTWVVAIGLLFLNLNAVLAGNNKEKPEVYLGAVTYTIVVRGVKIYCKLGKKATSAKCVVEKGKQIAKEYSKKGAFWFNVHRGPNQSVRLICKATRERTKALCLTNSRWGRMRKLFDGLRKKKVVRYKTQET
ncbi:MAG: hypothetical protein OXR68_06740 [Alphaproteobacteria bacterium]|nr:hypothetical protein [Alphaproteobacteria bacterium]MDD9920301.1 hypothetical protein [Alphaproteobacteria bacterium]